MDQTAMDYSHGSQGSPLGGLIMLVVYLGVWAFMWWKVFVKAGQPGWAAIVPIYNIYVLLKVGGKPWWWLILLIIPIVNFVMLLLLSLSMAKNFGKGSGFGIGLWLLSFIFYPILGFGSATYQAALPAKT